MSGQKSLADYLAQSGSERPLGCAICSLPPDIRQQVDAALRFAPRHAAIGRWLKEIMPDTKLPGTHRHYYSNHHLEGH